MTNEASASGGSSKSASTPLSSSLAMTAWSMDGPRTYGAWNSTLSESGTPLAVISLCPSLLICALCVSYACWSVADNVCSYSFSMRTASPSTRVCNAVDP